MSGVDGSGLRPSDDEWVTVLDELDRLVDRQLDALDRGLVGDGVDAGLVFVPPPGIGPAPAHAAERLQALLAATDALIGRTRELCERVRPLTHTAPPRPSGARIASSHFDRRA